MHRKTQRQSLAPLPLLVTSALLLCGPGRATPAQSGAPAKPGAQDTKESATSEKAPQGASSSSDTTAPADDSPWKRLRARLDEARKAELLRLEGLLEPRLADLGLDFASSDNRDYLQREFDKISQLDPDIPAALLRLLAPPKDEGSARNRADNARRILARFDMGPYRDELRALCDNAPTMRGRLRALRLLCRTQHPERLALLDKAIKNTPEVYVPSLLAAIGDSGQTKLAERVTPFLSRPNEKHRLAALAALARLADPASIEAARKATVELGNDSGYTSMLSLLENTIERLPPQHRGAFALALHEALARAESLDTSEALRALQLVSELPREGLGTAGTKLESALLGLVEHPSTDVQFRAARILLDRGDKRAVKKILERLDTFVKNNKKVPYAWQQRALAHRAFGEPKAALKDVNQAIRLSPTADPRLHLLAAELEISRRASSAIVRHLKAADATAEELAAFRRANPELEALLARNRQLRRLFGEK